MPFIQHTYQVKQRHALTKEEFEPLLSLLSTAFADDPLFGFLFHDSMELRRFLCVCLHYYLKMGRCYTASDETGKVCGAALWNEPGGRLITPYNVIKSGMLGAYLGLLLTLSPRSTYKMLKMSNLTQAHHIAERHWYLFLLASIQPGAGSALVEGMTAQLGESVVYLENSKPEKNAHFYHKLGFENLLTISWREGTVVPMARMVTTAHAKKGDYRLNRNR
ncbi:MAG: hypothetical protein PHS97_01090 [Oscillospiraceae bacterium]|nr:hypothetical protein [Oscillospiraceae bacterium]